MSSVILSEKVKTKTGGGVVAPARNAMTEDIVVDLKDMETYLEPNEYQAFLKAKGEVELYNTRRTEYEKKKADAEWFTAEYQKNRDKAKNDIKRTLWNARVIVSSAEAGIPAPYEPTYYFTEHDRYIGLARERKLSHLREEERRKAEEEAQRRCEEERKRREQQMRYADERRIMLADSEWDQFQSTFNTALKELKCRLGNPKAPKFEHGCSPEVLKYHPQSWCELELPAFEEVAAWAKPHVQEKIPEVLRPFVTWGLAPQIQVVPRVAYELDGTVPCLVWHFDIYVAAKVDLWLKESVITKDFHGQKYMAPVKAKSIGALFLGYENWDSEDGFTTPIRLLRLIAESNSEAPGIEVFIHEPSHTDYIVQGFDDVVEVRKQFSQFVKNTAENHLLAQGLRGLGLLDEEGAKLVEEKWDEPLPITGKVKTEGPDLEGAVSKLVELCWTEADAIKAVETTTFPNNATAEEIVGIILEKSQ